MFIHSLVPSAHELSISLYQQGIKEIKRGTLSLTYFTVSVTTVLLDSPVIVTLRMCFQLFSNSCYPVYIPSVSPFLVNFLADVPSVLLSVFRFSWIKN